jgi:hypothetical protein
MVVPSLFIARRAERKPCPQLKHRASVKAHRAAKPLLKWSMSSHNHHTLATPHPKGFVDFYLADDLMIVFHRKFNNPAVNALPFTPFLRNWISNIAIRTRHMRESRIILKYQNQHQRFVIGFLVDILVIEVNKSMIRVLPNHNGFRE